MPPASNSHDILVNREPWGSFMMDYEAGGNDWWVKPTKGKDFWVDSIDDLIKKIKADLRFKESIKEDSHDCGCNENHDCGCGGLRTH